MYASFMASQWFHLKHRACTLRRRGISIISIEEKLGIPRSTLSGWFRNITLTNAQKNILAQKKTDALKKARGIAAEYHRSKKRERIALAREKAQADFDRLTGVASQQEFFRFFLTALYIGEGAKNKSLLCFGNANPDICLAFVTLLRRSFVLHEEKFRCQLHLRDDQHVATEVRYWSRLLAIPPTKFQKSYRDARTRKTVTRKGYHGVCAIYYYDAELQKYIEGLSRIAIDWVLRARSSAG